MSNGSVSNSFDYAKFGIAIVLIATIGRWVVSSAGVPYLPRGNVIFSIVLATNFLALAYGGFLRAFTPLGYKQIVVTVLIVVFAAQSFVTVSTAISYLAGIDSYFNFPEALNVSEPMGFGQAMGARLFGYVPNMITGVILASLGYGLGRLFPKQN